MTGREDIVDALSRLALFADLGPAQLAAVVDRTAFAWFSAGDRILRQGLSGAGFHVILDGECAVLVGGEERARLGRGDFFGEISMLLDEPPVADVVALTGVRCLVIDRGAAEEFLLAYPQVMHRMLRVLAKRLHDANRWQR